MKVSALTDADQHRWTQLWQDYLTFYETQLPPEIYRNTWTRLMSGQDIFGLAARTEHGIVGITHYLFHPHAWSLNPACYLQDLFVDAAIRNSGAGRALIEAVANKAREAGADRLYWTTQETNAKARRLYDRIAINRGFIKYDYPLP